MKTFLICSLLACSAAGQQTRYQKVNPSPNPADDAKPNSEKVPDVYAIEGQFDRVVTLRFKFGSDLLAGFEKIVAQQKIRNAVILSALGSVRGYHIHQVSNRDLPSKNM